MRTELVEAGGGARLRTWTAGTRTGLPPVVLLHGGPGLWDYLEPVALMLEPLTVVHRFDQRGCGGSGAGDPPDYSLARAVADLESLRRHWGHETWSVVGHSFGATLAFAYAVSHPRRTSALGYLGGAGLGDWRGPARAEAARRMTAGQRRRRAELERRPWRDRAEETEFRALCWFPDHADRERAWDWAVEDARPDVPINWSANRGLTAEDRRRSPAGIPAQAARLTMPSWFLHGAGDPRPAHTVAALAATTPNATFHLIEGAGHHPWRERPGELRTLLTALVRESVRNPDVARGPATTSEP